ncbi:MAG: hypothetical protein J5U17_00675 [Candidatus Methanoperedens sp.]|nr:hypothetical protein [Candidatus Methanoperedens sp.]MCE8424275.1 hypothetical protein [Candidatus Methanoperedens sp.]MCE8426854.1 hypothetical protein [Candidatus Methanoperedens sp.]
MDAPISSILARSEAYALAATVDREMPRSVTMLIAMECYLKEESYDL